MTSIAIIGAGMAGLSAAYFLKDVARVTVFEKARGVSGRMSTRRAEPYFFDHGAQYFTARSDSFKAFLKPLIDAGFIQPWHARFVEIENGTISDRRQWDDVYPHYVGVPGMNAVAKHLAKGLDVQVTTRVGRLLKTVAKWAVYDDQENLLGEYDWVISAIPAEQATELLPDSLPFYSRVEATRSLGCFSLMLGFEQPLSLEFDAAMVKGHDLSWISVNSSKPGRSGDYSLLVHADNLWADQHIDDDRVAVITHLCRQVSDILGHDVNQATHKVMHAWRYANIGKQQGDRFLLDEHQQIGVCGDWLIQGRVEAAFLSAFEMQNQLKSFFHNNV